MNIFIIAAATGIAAIIYLMTKKKITNGSSCCSEHEKPVEHVKAGDTNAAHYPYHYLLKVEGMVCANCAKRVENAFNETGEMLALADLGKKEVRLSSKRMLDRRETAKIVDAAGYTMIGLWLTQYVVVSIIFQPQYLYKLYELYCFTVIFWVENWSAADSYIFFT